MEGRIEIPAEFQHGEWHRDAACDFCESVWSQGWYCLEILEHHQRIDDRGCIFGQKCAIYRFGSSQSHEGARGGIFEKWPCAEKKD